MRNDRRRSEDTPITSWSYHLMVKHEETKTQTTGEAPSAKQLEAWARMVDGLPDVRLARVMKTRRAIRQNAYAQDAVLDETVRRVGRELGIE